MNMPNMGGANAPHKPTIGWTIGIIVVVVIGYHFLVNKRGR